MKLHDSVLGALLLAVATFALWQVRSFPPVPGQPYGAALFPGLAAGALAVCALALIARGLMARRSRLNAVSDATDASASTSAETAGIGGLPLLLTVGAIVFYIVLADRLGFIITGAVILTVLMAAYGVALRWILPISIIATLVIHTAFYKLLKVPLPWGLLQPLAW